MKKNEVVKKRRDFDLIINQKRFVKNKDFIIYYKDNKCELNHFGISVGKKIGNAVTRNYYKRIIRNICDINKKYYSNTKDYIIIMRYGCKAKEFSEINKSFISLINMINKEKEKQNEKENKD